MTSCVCLNSLAHLSLTWVSQEQHAELNAEHRGPTSCVTEPRADAQWLRQLILLASRE